MFRFYRTHYAGQRSFVVNAAVYGGIVAKLCVSLVTTAARRRLASVRGSRSVDEKTGSV
jgi:hypothetical protein